MTVLPSGGNDTPALLVAGHTGEDIGPGNFLLLSPLSPLPSGFSLRGRGKRITNFIVGPGASAFSHHSQAVGLNFQNISFIGAPGQGSSAGQLWGSPNPTNPADVSGYLSLVSFLDCEFVFLAGELDIRYCMGGLTVQRCDWNGGGNGLHTYDCGEFEGSSLRFNNMTGWHVLGEGPQQGPTGSDHSAEDWKLANSTGNGGSQGVILRNIGFFSITGCDFTACVGGPALTFQGTCSDGSVDASIWGGINTPTQQQHAVVFDNSSLPQLRGPHSSISITNSKMDGSCIGVVAFGCNELQLKDNQLTANSNVDILLVGCTKSQVVGNTCDSSSFLYGSARNSIFESGGGNNSINSNSIRQPIAQGGSGSEYMDNRTIV